MKSAIVLVNLGTPSAPTATAVRRFLKQFLSDRRVVEVPRPIWWLILNLIILPFRSPRVAKNYNEIWMGGQSPLRVFCERLQGQLAAAIQQQSLSAPVQVELAMTYGDPSIEDVLSRLGREGVERIFFLPLFPQYSATTTAAVLDQVTQFYSRQRDIPQWSWLRDYHDHPAFIQALADRVRAHWQEKGRGDKLLMSFHGIPKRNVELGDPYQSQCEGTASALAAALSLEEDQWMMTFQSRLGKAEWLQPYTDKTLAALPSQGVKRLDVICPAFAVECLETLEEIDGEGQEIFRDAGGESFNYIPCLNDHAVHTEALLTLCEPFLRELHN
ncbi:ferrochelatase [Spongiibacter nanhainus]|uniref:Ferrochelatase n=1 Tax=Spongiibacter nanhainus TaxID=2794344 RepID=A0A7T4R2Z5_9GAMM|nr:ferrochelatase [Spongiibacter nanhainus]QQD19227.1 ferrochelatase [Spongiibacter nanhainus]